MKSVWQKIVEFFKTQKWAKWVAIGLAAVVVVTAVVVPLAASGSKDTGRHVSSESFSKSEKESERESDKSDFFISDSMENDSESVAEEESTDKVIIPEENGSKGLEYKFLSDGTYAVSGIGTCTDFDIIIPSTYQGIPVTQIYGEESSWGGRNGAFSFEKQIFSVVIPDSVTEIGGSAFDGCENLMSVTFGKSLKKIGVEAFDWCTSLESVELPDSVTEIGEQAFGTCTSLTSIIAKGVKIIGGYSFIDCHSLTELTFNSVESVGYYAFCDCENLTSIELPSIVEVSRSAFVTCYNLENIMLGDGAVKIGEGAFDDTKYYEDDANWENGVLYIGNHLIKGNSKLTSYTVKDGTRCIADEAFSSCEKLLSINLPNTITGIGEEAFEYSGLEKIELPSSVKYIGNYAFYNANLTEIKLPDSITEIGYSAFYGTPYYENSSNWEDGILYIGNYLIKADSSVMGTYSIKEGIRLIAAEAFTGNTKLRGIIMPESLKYIGYSVFNRCTYLSDVTFVSGIKSIGSLAFSNCEWLKSLTYNGTIAQWNAIEKGSDWNENVPASEVVCSDGVVAI